MAEQQQKEAAQEEAAEAARLEQEGARAAQLRAAKETSDKQEFQALELKRLLQELHSLQQRLHSLQEEKKNNDVVIIALFAILILVGISYLVAQIWLI